MNISLRKKPRISYYEPDEPAQDEYLFCDRCMDFVYEYCAIHGHLLVIPDDEVTQQQLPRPIPQAALTIPGAFLHLAPSVIPGAGIGVFSTLTIPRGVRFGPFKGKQTVDSTSDYCWQIFNSDNKPSHVIDASDPSKSNWMRYVNCARHWNEQNLVAYQYQGQLYYRTIKIVPKFTELLVFYGSEFAHHLGIDLKRYNSTQSQYLAYNTVAKKNTMPPPRNTHEYIEIIIDDKPFIKQEPPDYYDEDFDNTFICDICQTHFTTRELIIHHFQTPDECRISEYNCPRCIFKTKSERAFVNHTKHHDVGRKHVCPVCNLRFDRESKLHIHMKPRFICEVEYTCFTKYKCELKNGLKQLHCCPFCEYTNERINQMPKHIMTHTGERPFRCDVCNFGFTRKSDYNRHVRRMKIQKNGVRERFCASSVRIQARLKKSLEENLNPEPQGPKRWRCNMCHYSSERSSDVKRHKIRIHDQTYLLYK